MGWAILPGGMGRPNARRGHIKGKKVQLMLVAASTVTVPI